MFKASNSGVETKNSVFKARNSAVEAKNSVFEARNSAVEAGNSRVDRENLGVEADSVKTGARLQRAADGDSSSRLDDLLCTAGFGVQAVGTIIAGWKRC
jgi:hypothetical protein